MKNRVLYINQREWDKSVSGAWNFFGIAGVRIIAKKSKDGWTAKIRKTRKDPVLGHVDDFIFGVASSRWMAAKRAYDNYLRS